MLRSLLKSVAFASARHVDGKAGWLKDLGWYGQKVRVRDLLESAGIDLVIDVGANGGQFALELRRLGYRGEIVSFEPNPKVFARLEAEAARDGKWRCHCVALGREPGTLSLNITESPEFASFLAPGVGPQLEGNTVVGKTEVPVARLDDYLRQLGVAVAGRGVFFKSDTQGYDLEVLSGAPELLKAARLLQIEVSCDPIYKGMPNIATALDYVLSRGFKVLEMLPVTRVGSLGHVVEYDCLLTAGTPS